MIDSGENYPRDSEHDQTTEDREFSIGNPPTPDEVRTLELPSLLHPIERLGAIASVGKSFGLRKVGSSPLPLYMTRGDLLRSAKSYEKAKWMLDVVRGFDQDADTNDLK